MPTRVGCDATSGKGKASCSCETTNKALHGKQRRKSASTLAERKEFAHTSRQPDENTQPIRKMIRPALHENPKPARSGRHRSVPVLLRRGFPRGLSPLEGRSGDRIALPSAGAQLDPGPTLLALLGFKQRGALRAFDRNGPTPRDAVRKARGHHI